MKQMPKWDAIMVARAVATVTVGGRAVRVVTVAATVHAKADVSKVATATA